MLSLKKVTEYTLLICFAVLPFSNALINIAFAILSLLVITIFIKEKQSLKLNFVTISFTLLSIYLMINGLFQGSYEANKTLWKMLPLLFFGNLIFSNYRFSNLDLIKKVSIYSCALYIIFSLIRALLFYKSNGFLPFANGQEIKEILTIHRPYLGIYIVLNLIFILEFLKSKISYIFIALFLLLSGYLIIISARLSILTLLIIGSIYLLFYTKLTLKKKLLYSSIFVLFTSLFTILNPNFRDRMKPESVELFIDYEPRFVIWESVKTIYNNDDYNIVFGYGNYNLIEEYLVINYDNKIQKDSKREYYISERFNTHSQYLDYLLFGGIIGFVLFIIYSLLAIYSSIIEFKNIAIAITFILFFIVENVFHRQFGCYVFLLYMVLFVHQTKSHFYLQGTFLKLF